MNTLKKLSTTSLTISTIRKMQRTRKQTEVDNLFCPNEEGVSRWVSREEMQQNQILGWGNNGCGRHGIYFADNRYIWEKQGTKKIEMLRTNGYNTSYTQSLSRPIRKDIDKYYKQQCCVVCGSHSDLTTDHKNDLYNDTRVLDIHTQTLDDFQCLCRHCNLQKRQVAKETKKTGRRYGATNILHLSVFGVDFVEGDETFDPSNSDAMVGTFWYDPLEFMKKLKQNIIGEL